MLVSELFAAHTCRDTLMYSKFFMSEVDSPDPSGPFSTAELCSSESRGDDAPPKALLLMSPSDLPTHQGEYSDIRGRFSCDF